MRLAEIDENGRIVNVIEADQRPDWAQDWPDIGIAAGPGWSYIGGEFVAPPAPVVDINVVRDDAVAAINRRAGEVRTLFIGAVAEQAAISAAQEAEARRYLDASPVPADLSGYPWLAAEVGITAPTATALAQHWLSQAGMRTVMLASVEQIRAGNIATVNDIAAQGAPVAAINDVVASAYAAFDQVAANAP